MSFFFFLNQEMILTIILAEFVAILKKMSNLQNEHVLTSHPESESGITIMAELGKVNTKDGSMLRYCSF